MKIIDETQTENKKQTPVIDSEEEVIIKERKTRQSKPKITKSNLHADLTNYSDALANLVNDDKFILEQNEAVSLSQAIERLTTEFEIEINSRINSVVNLIFVFLGISLRRKKNILALIKSIKNGKGKE